MADFPSRWEWLFCVVVFSSCQLSSASIQAGYVFNGDPEFATITGPTPYERVSTSYIASSPNDFYALALTIQTSKTSSPVCYLQIFYLSANVNPANASQAPPPGAHSSFLTYPWTQPCPLKTLPNGNCSFAFTKDGDIQLRNSVAGNSILVWNSNTSGLGITTLEVRDYDIVNDTFGNDGNLILLNSSGSEVWANARNGSNFMCGDPATIATSSTTKNKASILTLLCLVLISVLGAGLGRNNQLLLILVCCVLLSSTSESKPIQAGFTTYAQYFNFSNAESGAVSTSSPVLESPANRTVLQLTVYVTKGWGPVCYLEVAADRHNADVIVNASSNSSNTFEYVPWSAPCPRKTVPVSGNCTFVFTAEGDIQVLSGNGLVWSSNTAGLGATSLDVLDSDPSATGSILLYNSRNETVWKNVQNMTDVDFQCVNPNPNPNPNGASSFDSPVLLVVLSTALLLKLLLFPS